MKKRECAKHAIKPVQLARAQRKQNAQVVRQAFFWIWENANQLAQII